MAVTFVYRSHYEGPLSKRVVRFDDASVLAWFKRVWPDLTGAPEPGKALEQLLGCRVYGFATLFEAAKKAKLAAPTSTATLKALVGQHLYVEGTVRIDAHSFRAKTDDDEVELAYLFFDDKAAAPERVAYLLHEGFPLPTGGKKGPFTCPVDVEPISPKRKGEGRTYAVLLTFYDSESLPFSPPSVFEGVRVPDLLAYLRATPPPAGKAADDYPDTWPLELRLLRACIDDADTSLAPAARRAAAYPLHAVGQGSGTGRAGLGSVAEARASFEKLARKVKGGHDPEKSLVDVSDHVIQIATHQSEFFGYQQWFLFDDLWASAHPDLAASLLRHGTRWDPFSDDDDDDDEGDDD